MKRMLVTLAPVLVSAVALAQSEKPATVPAQPIAPAKPAAAAPAEEIKPLSIGDVAPAYDIESWVQGNKVASFPAGKVTVLEFWATWCGPCKQSIPHLSEMNDRFKDYGVTFIGVSDEKLETVTGFLAKDEWKEKMRYTVATDPDKSTYKSYMTAAGQGGIPTAFVIGKTGKVEWIGHPMVGLDEVVEQVVNDKWDSKAYKAKFDAEVAANNARRAVMKDLSAARKANDWAKVVSIDNELLAKNPDDVSAQVGKLEALLLGAKRYDEGYTLATSIAEKNAKNPMVLNQIAWMIVDAPGLEKRNLDVATKIAEQGVEASGGKNGAILDTLARCYWDKGDKAKAIATQKKAVEAEGSGPMADELKKTLATYTSGT
ncbi:MAG: redoxin domain-containing protein [Phycisphaerae bacterium]|nr:redoxin domain-containing protein [Phycisphaerae bacterium]